MNGVEIQFIATCICVLAAVLFLARKMYRLLNRQGGCASGTCGGCHSKPDTPDNFVALETLEQQNARS